MFFECAELLLGRLLKIFKRGVVSATALPLIIIVEGLRINQHGDHDVADAALDQVLQRDTVRTGRLGHVPKLVLEVVDFVLGRDASSQLLNHLSEEHIDHKCVNCAFVVDV